MSLLEKKCGVRNRIQSFSMPRITDFAGNKVKICEVLIPSQRPKRDLENGDDVYMCTHVYVTLDS